MSSGKATVQADSDVHITYEDQQKINKFARLNAKLEVLKDEIKQKQNDLKCLEDAVEEIALLDDDEKIAYLIGEVFIYQNTEKTQSSLEDAKTDIQQEIKDLTSESVGVTELMSDLKTHLYGKFGSSINLEAEEE